MLELSFKVQRICSARRHGMMSTSSAAPLDAQSSSRTSLRIIKRLHTNKTGAKKGSLLPGPDRGSHRTTSRNPAMASAALFPPFSSRSNPAIPVFRLPRPNWKSFTEWMRENNSLFWKPGMRILRGVFGKKHQRSKACQVKQLGKNKKNSGSWAWWGNPSTQGRVKQKDPKFEPRLDNLVRPHLNTKIFKWRGF